MRSSDRFVRLFCTFASVAAFSLLAACKPNSSPSQADSVQTPIQQATQPSLSNQVAQATIVSSRSFGQPSAVATLELFPSYNTVGVNVALTIADPQKDAWASLESGPAADRFKRGFPLSRVDNEFQRLSGCIFWCQPEANYHVRVTLHDATTSELDGVVLNGRVTTRRNPSFPQPEKTLYVSPAGKGKAFTRSKPGALKDGLASVRAGQRLMLLEGTYSVGNLKLAQSGSVGKPIQIEGETRGKVVLDGAQAKRITWRESAQHKGLYIADSEAINPNLVLADGKRLYPHQTLDDLLNHKITVGLDVKGRVRFDAELDGFYRNPSQNPLLNGNWRAPRRLYVKFRDNSDPNGKAMVVTRFNHGLTIAGQSYVTLKNLRFAHFGRAPTGVALDLRNCHDIVVDHCTFGMNDIGISLKDDCSRITIQDSEFFDSMQGYFAWKIKATYDLHAPYSTIFPYLSRMLERGGIIYSHGFRGRGIVTRRCRFHDFAQAGHLGPASFNRQFQDSYEIDFHDNVVFNCTEDGMELDGDARNIRIWGNTFHHCNAPLSLAVASGGPTYVLRNVFHSITADIFTIVPADGLKTEPGHAFKFSTGDTKSRIGDLFLIHNTIDAGNTAVGFHLTSPARWKRCFARNNAVVSDLNHALQVQTQEPLPIDIDYNAYWTHRGPTIGHVGPRTSDSKTAVMMKSIEQFRKLGWEKHGLIARPGFIDAAKHNYRLKSHSVLINRGQLIHGINDLHTPDSRPDIGAFELHSKE